MSAPNTETPTAQAGSEAKQDKRKMRGLWAPGEYSCLCNHCSQRFIGDKRAAWCADCAYGDSPNTQPSGGEDNHE